MKRPIIEIDGFKQGILSDKTIPARDGFNFGAGIDIHTDPGILQVSQKFTAMDEAAATDNITDLIQWIVKYSDNNKLYGLGNGRIYDYDNTVADKWSLVHDDSNTCYGQGMIEFNGNLHWASNNNLGKFDGTTWTDSFKAFTGGDIAWHPMVIFNGNLYVGDGKYVAKLETDDTWSATKLELAPGYRIRSMAVYGDRIYIGTWRGTSLSDHAEATMFSWDGLSTTYETSFTLKEAGINALVSWNNYLVVFAGVKGNIYFFNGATLKKILKLPKSGTATGFSGEVYPGAVAEYQGGLLFGWSSANTEYAGIYSLNQDKEGSPLALTAPYITSTGDTAVQVVGALLQSSSSGLYASFWDKSTAYYVDTASGNRRITTGAYSESQVYQVAPRGDRVRVDGVELVASQLQTANTVAIKYKLDEASAWSTLGTMTSTNQYKVMWGIGEVAKTVQIRLEFTTSSINNNTPEISLIRIY